MENKNFNIKVLQWNCRSVRNKLELLNNAQEYDIIIAIESWLKPETDFHISSFETTRFDRLDEKGGGIAFFVKKHIVYNVIHLDFSPIFRDWYY